MQLKTLLYNRGIFIQNARSVGWIGIAYLICLLFALPLQIWMIFSSNEDYQRHYLFTTETLFRFSEEFQLILMFTVPVLLAVFLFRYLHVKLTADYLHSLPIKRIALYNQNIVFGIAMLIIPVVIIAVVLLVLIGFVDAPEILNVAVISKWMWTTILINIFVFFAGVFVAMFTGISVFQGVLTYVLFIFPAGVVTLFLMNLKYLLYGFAVDYYLKQQLEKIIPFIRADQLSNQSLTGKETFIFLLFIAIFYGIALLVYRKRKVEMATQAVAFRSLQPVFLYGVTFCTMLLGGMYFGETQGTMGWRIFGYISASIIGYFIALMILEKTWRVLTKWKGYSLFLVSMIIVALIIQFDITGYEKRIPAADQVERVFFAESVGWMRDQSRNYLEHEDKFAQSFYYDDPTNIENIRKLHDQIIKEKVVTVPNNRYYRQATFAYELDNGRKLVRTYRVPESFYEVGNILYGKIVASDEHKWNTQAVLRIEDTSKVDKITTNSQRGMKEPLTFTNSADIESFHQLLQTEISEETFAEMTSKRGEWAHIEYLLSDNKRIGVQWKKSYDQIEAWLKERGLLEAVRVTASDIAFIVVIKNEYEYLHEYTKTYEDTLAFDKREDAIRIENNDLIEVILQASSWNDRGEYVVGYYYTRDTETPVFETIQLDSAPAFIKEKLN